MKKVSIFESESFIESFAQPIGSKTPVENKTDYKWITESFVQLIR